MAREISSLQQLLEVVRQSNRVELDDAAGELLNSTRMHISVHVAMAMQEVEAEHDLMSHIEHFLEAEVLLAERFPVRNRVGDFHLDEDERVGHDPVPLNRDKVLMSEALECFNHLEGASSFLLIERRDINACYHFVHACLRVTSDKYLTISLSEVERYHHVGIVVGVWRVAPCLSELH